LKTVVSSIEQKKGRELDPISKSKPIQINPSDVQELVCRKPLNLMVGKVGGRRTGSV